MVACRSRRRLALRSRFNRAASPFFLFPRFFLSAPPRPFMILWTPWSPRPGCSLMRGLLSFLHVAYFPFVGFLGFLQFALAAFFLAAAIFVGGSGLYVFFAVVFFVLFCWFVAPMVRFLTWQP